MARRAATKGNATAKKTERRQRADEALRESEERLSTTLNSIGDAVIATDRKGCVTFLNPAAQSLTGWQQEDAVGKPLKDVFNIVSEETGRQIEDPVTKVIREGVVVGLANHTVLIAKDGTKLPIDDSGAPIRDCQGNITGVVLVFHDISERKRAEEARNRLLPELERLSHRLLYVQEEERRQIAYDIHDGPTQQIVAAHMYLETYRAEKRQKEDPQVEGYLEQAKSYLGAAIQESRRIISDLRPTVLDDLGLAEALRHYLGEVRGRTDRQVEFQTDMNGIRLDAAVETALFRIAQEAVTNALKHSGTDRLSVSFLKTHSGTALEVRDWGQGFNVADTLAGVSGGRQVGLFSMKERAQLVGGELTIESTPGEGTAVRLTLPITQGEEKEEGRLVAVAQRNDKVPRPNETANGGIRVLIADDHPMVRQGLRSMLNTKGIEVVGEAGDGKEAVERVRELKPDVVIMDVRMPDMDGLAATEVVKEEAPWTSVIIVTSYESKDYLRRAIEVGAAGYLLKGMSRDALIEAIKLVRGGGSLIDAKLLAELLQEMGVQGSRFEGAPEGALEALSPREQEVLQLLVRGLTNKEIATEMHYSLGTVKNVVQRVIEKLGVSDRTQAAVYAVRAGIPSP